MPGALLWGWDATNKVWIPLQVDANGLVKVDLSNINLDDLADVSVAAPTDGYVLYWDNATSLWKCKKVDGSNLSQTFGASAGRLRNLIVDPIAGEILRVLDAGASPFSAKINGTPTSTSVVYDGDSNENMFRGLAAYNGSTYWGQIILHNTTRGNSRKIVSVNRATNTITTTSSTDDWADNDDITCQSQTNTQASYFDVDVSAQVPTTTDAIFLFAVCRDDEGADDTNRVVYFHPYESYGTGKRQFLAPILANAQCTFTIPLKVVSQKITMSFFTGCVDVVVLTSVQGSVEFADT